jgi:hypothetical protein
MTLHVQVIPPHDHDALLNASSISWNITTKLPCHRSDGVSAL